MKTQIFSYLFIILAILTACNEQQKELFKDALGDESEENQVEVKNNEKRFIYLIFGKSIDINKINFVFNSVYSIGSTRTIKNTILFDEKNDITNEEYRKSKSFILLLSHESTHIWQFQTAGIFYLADSLYNQIKGQISHKKRTIAYEYNLTNKAFDKYSSEQQAKIIEEYVALKVFDIKPRRCKNYNIITKDQFINRVEKLIKRDINQDFKPLDAKEIIKLFL